MATHWTLTPNLQVRILSPQPKEKKMKLPKILRPEIEIEIYSFGGLLQAVKVCVIIGVKRMRVTYKLLGCNYMTHKFIVIPKYKFVKGREKD